MKQLNRIVLVNWYVLGAVEVPIKGNVAIIGPNGSGKSSILDAIQTVLMGGNKKFLSFNASAGDKSERSLRTYCLGFMDDLGKKETDQQDSISYLALSFFDTETGHETCVDRMVFPAAAIPVPARQNSGAQWASGISSTRIAGSRIIGT